MKMILSVLVTLLSFCICHSAYSTSKIRLAYLYSSSVLPASNQEKFLIGFEIGLNSSLTSHQLKSIEINKITSADTSLVSIYNMAKDINENRFDVVTGLTTSHDALMAIKAFQSKQHLPFILAIGAGHMQLDDFGNDVYTTGERIADNANSMFELMQDKYPNSEVYVIRKVESVFSVGLVQSVLDITTTKKVNILDLDTMGRIKESDLNKINQNSVLLVTPYVEESEVFMEQLISRNLDVPIIGNSSWVAIDHLKRLVSKKNSPIYVLGIWNPGGEENSELISEVSGLRPVNWNNNLVS